MERLVVIGAGMASGRLLEHLTETAPGAFDITLFNAEPRGCYNRLMLSPVLSGETTWPQIVTHDAAWYAARRVTCRFGERVTAIDRNARMVRAPGGDVPYDRLVIATGSAPVTIPVPGHDLHGVVAYRDLDDTETMIAAASLGGRAVVIGGGLLGLEAAAGLAQRGMTVTVLHLADHLMNRQLDTEAASLLQADLEDRGITIRTGASTRAILGQRRVEAVQLDDGTQIPADLVVMAVGIRPITGLASEAGLLVERGITVDAQMRTSDPAIHALGECVEHDGQLFGLVAPLYDQAQVLANTLLGRADTYVHRELATKLKVTGCDLFSAGDFTDAPGRECILLRDPARHTYKRLVIEDERLIGAVLYGDTRDGAWFFDLIQQATPIDGMRDTLIFGPAFAPEQAAPEPQPQRTAA